MLTNFITAPSTLLRKTFQKTYLRCMCIGHVSQSALHLPLVSCQVSVQCLRVIHFVFGSAIRADRYLHWPFEISKLSVVDCILIEQAGIPCAPMIASCIIVLLTLASQSLFCIMCRILVISLLVLPSASVYHPSPSGTCNAGFA